MIVYKITNLLDDKKYVGQTIFSLEHRWKQHQSKRSDCRYLKHAIQKYGKDNFEIKILSRCISTEEMNHREQYYIKLFNTLAPNGYNLLSGGKNRKASIDTKKKMSESHKKSWTQERKLKQSLATKGKKHSKEHKLKISAGLMGHVVTSETLKKLSNSHMGQKAWNKGLFGVMKANSASFKPGNVAPNKGRRKVIIDGKIKMIKPEVV